MTRQLAAKILLYLRGPLPTSHRVESRRKSSKVGTVQNIWRIYPGDQLIAGGKLTTRDIYPREC